jgi:3',5'-nucleoside bisphosphate phosphatase
MEYYPAELHVHTVLSPCASVEMIPPLIVQHALEHGARMIAITDHNSSANVGAVQQAAKNTPLVVFPGMEMQTIEEVHLLCLFEHLSQLLEWQKKVDSHLPDIQNNSDYFGAQYIVDSTGDYLASENRLLISSVQLTIEQAVKDIHALGGLAIPAHIDRKAFGLLAMLGMIPEDVPFDALEISRYLSPEIANENIPSLASFPLIQSGDVHHLDDFLVNTHFFLQSPTFTEIHYALQQESGRYVEICGKY